MSFRIPPNFKSSYLVQILSVSAYPLFLDHIIVYYAQGLYNYDGCSYILFILIPIHLHLYPNQNRPYGNHVP